MRLLAESGRLGDAAFRKMQAELKMLGASTVEAERKLQALNNQLMQAEQKAGDANRALSRKSAQGFANMIISQAAWMAGFQVIFGTLDRFKAAMNAVLETQLAVARAMRTMCLCRYPW